MSRSFHAEVKKFSGIWCMYFVSMGENQSLVNNICLVRNNYVLVGNIIFSMSKKKVCNILILTLQQLQKIKDFCKIGKLLHALLKICKICMIWPRK